METLYTLSIFIVLVGVLAVPYWIHTARHRREAEKKFHTSSKGGFLTPVTLHARINVMDCIGCASCVKICPDDALGIVNGRAAIVNGLKCVGHGLCVDVCPVGAITLGFGAPKEGMEIPYYDDHYQSNIEGLYIAGELGGIGMIKNAVTQGIKAIEHIAQKKTNTANTFDVIIVGAGPAGLAASLAAQANHLRYVVLEQRGVGGTISHYPRQKLVLTSPVELPLHGKLKMTEVTKEQLLDLWQTIISGYNLNIITNLKVDTIEKRGPGFVVRSSGSEWVASNVILGLGRRGSPRKLGVTGEELPKVAYELVDATSYHHKHLLIVGGGDSAVEAAIALAIQPGNTVTISYRRDAFVRLKEKNEQRIYELMKTRKINVVFNSSVGEITVRSAALLNAEGKRIEVLNDYVFIFAGGEPPTELLKKIGVQMRTAEFETRMALAG